MVTQPAPSMGAGLVPGIFSVTLTGIQGMNAGRAGTRGSLWFVQNPNVVGHITASGALATVTLGAAKGLTMIAPASDDGAWVIDSSGSSVFQVRAGKVEERVTLPEHGSVVSLASPNRLQAWIGWRDPDELILVENRAQRVVWRAPAGRHLMALATRAEHALVALDGPPGLIDVSRAGATRIVQLPTQCQVVRTVDVATDDAVWAACGDDARTIAIVSPSEHVKLISVPDVEITQIFAVSHDTAWLYDGAQSKVVGLYQSRVRGSISLGATGLPGTRMSQLTAFVAIDSQEYLWFGNNRSRDITRRGPLYELINAWPSETNSAVPVQH